MLYNGKIVYYHASSFIDKQLNQDLPVDAEITLSEMEFDEGNITPPSSPQ
jgi:hypothetical protein